MRLTRTLFAAFSVLALTFPLSAFAGSTMNTIKVKKTIALGYRDASIPFSYIGNDRKPRGYSVELCTKVAKSIQEQLRLDRLDIKWVLVEPANRMEKLKKGGIDLECGSTTATLSRMREVDFSLTTFVDGGSYMSRAEGKINTLADLRGKKTGVASGTTTEKNLKHAIASKQFDSELIMVKDHDDGLRLLAAGKIDAYASDRGLLIGLMLGSGNQAAWKLGDELFSFEPYALMMRRDDPEFRLAVNREIVRIYSSREIFEIFDRWFGVIAKPSELFNNMVLLNSLPE